MEVVPADEAPQPPSGKGWSCVDVSTRHDDIGSATGQSAHTEARCYRTKADCAGAADPLRVQPENDVGFCAPEKAAWRYAAFSSDDDAVFACVRDEDDCGPAFGVIYAPTPGVKRSECARYR